MGDSGAMNRLPEWLTYRILAWIACVLLILVHVPGAIAGRVVVVKAIAFVSDAMNRLGDIGDWPNIENENVIVVNPPCRARVGLCTFLQSVSPPATAQDLAGAGAGLHEL